MATSTTLVLGDVIEEAMALLYRPVERPMQCAVGSDALTSSSADTTCTLSGDYSSVRVSTVIESGQELILVTARSADATPIFTVARGYAGTPVSAHTTGTVVLVGPLWARYEVRRSILRCFNGPLSAYLPNLTSTTLTTATNSYFVSMPAATVDVVRVAVSSVLSGSVSHWDEISQWDFIEDVPTAVVSTGKMLTFPYGFPTGQSLHVTYQTTYAWSGGTSDPAEAETVPIPAAGADLPALYAAAYQVFAREISRLELDRISEWNSEAAVRQGVNLRMAQTLWTEFYRRLDEARKVQNVPRHRAYRPMRTMSNGRWTNGAPLRRRG